jgi:hypothetical protein
LQLLARSWEEVVLEVHSEPRMLQDILKRVNPGSSYLLASAACLKKTVSETGFSAQNLDR